MGHSIGIDQSLLATGFVALSDTKFDDTYYFEVIKPKKIKGVARLDYIVRTICSLVQGCKRVNIIVLEDYAYAGSKIPFTLGELGGVLKLLFYTKFFGTPVVIVPPSTLKKYVTGKGNANKVAMVAAVKERWGQEFKDHNAADAYSLAKLGLVILKPEKTKEEQELLTKIRYVQNEL
jgi:crossover junction endodeoxyribonuclease RuvC